MSDSTPFNCMMIGLPRTGKTTFLAALWHVVRSQEVPNSLVLHRREGDQEYLNRIASEWSKCIELDRTPGVGEGDIRILLQNPGSQEVIRLEIPDMSGEIFQAQWELRQCTSEFEELTRRLDGCLLFVHPEKVVEPELIVDANRTLGLWNPGVSMTEEIGDNPNGPVSKNTILIFFGNRVPDVRVLASGFRIVVRDAAGTLPVWHSFYGTRVVSASSTRKQVPYY